MVSVCSEGLTVGLPSEKVPFYLEPHKPSKIWIALAKDMAFYMCKPVMGLRAVDIGMPSLGRVS